LARGWQILWSIFSGPGSVFLQGQGGIVPWPKMRVPFLEQGGKIISPFGWAQGCLVRALKDLDHQMVGQMVVGYPDIGIVAHLFPELGPGL
jgi:hypothetical protein